MNKLKQSSMKKMLPLVLAILSIILCIVLIARHEWHLSHSKSIYVKLQPVDPRSLIQGDYMALNYDLYFGGKSPVAELSDAQIAKQAKEEELQRQYFENQKNIVSYVQLDAQRKVIRTSFKPNVLAEYPNASTRLILKNPDNTFEGLYPAANSFMFAEGLEACYRDAKYAELKVQENGKPLLVGLVGEQLQSLNCEQKYAWWKGPREISLNE